jgi:aspartyl-tRNA(Asn)/glutamyl-tRNA(Gln) amidotransferase subunit B
MAVAYGDWEPVIGLEIHVQLQTQTKTFCACTTRYGEEPNTQVCAVCLGLPGALPVLNRKAVLFALRASMALGCELHETSVFARKNYFYPDLPKGYQISQFDRPLATGGRLHIDADCGPRVVGITRVHMEEDAGKNVHGVGGVSRVDLNRAGTPLVEIVGEPDLRSPAEARDCMRRIHSIVTFVGINDGNLEQGSFRCDANVSIRKRGDEAFGTRVEMKNINSFRFVEDAVDIEIRRQIREVEAGRAIRQQTRGYNSDKRESYLLRDKEGDAGYRYFPDPDLPHLVLSAAILEEARQGLCELPQAKEARYVDALGLSPYAAGVMVSHPAIATFFEAVVDQGAPAVKAANFIQAELMRDITTRGLSADIPLSPVQLAELLALVDAGSISGKQSKAVYAKVKGSDKRPQEIVDALGMAVISDASALQALAQELIEKHPKQVASYRAGKTNLLGFFVGQMMKATKGSANPKMANQLLRQLLDEAPES